MKYLSKVIVIACAIAVLLGSTRVAAQVSVDLENRYSNVGAIMVWRVDSSGTPLQLLGFASGTLIRDRVMVTAGHFTAPAKALGNCHLPFDFLRVSVRRMRRTRRTGFQWSGKLRTHRCRPAHRRLSAIQPTKSWSLHWSLALPMLD